MNNRREIIDFIAGMILLAVLHVAFVAIAIPITAVVRNDASPYAGLEAMAYVLLSLGITQLLYALPLSLFLKRKGRQAMLKGVIATGVITVLLNSGCFMLMFV